MSKRGKKDGKKERKKEKQTKRKKKKVGKVLLIKTKRPKTLRTLKPYHSLLTDAVLYNNHSLIT